MRKGSSKPVRRRLAAAVAGLGLAWAAAPASSAPAAIIIDDKDVFPESLTATRAGDLIIGSSAKGAIYRARAGASTAKLWIDPSASNIAALLGVFADDRSHTLYACSVARGAAPDKADGLSALRTFDLETGAAKAAYPLPGGAKALCNDIAVAANGTAYVSETLGGRILRLKAGASGLEVWLADPALAGVDGIAMGGDGAVYVNTVSTGRMFRVAVSPNGAAGALTELQPSVKLGGPDGLRSIGGLRFLQAENREGRVSVVTVSGDKATVAALKTGEPWVTSAVLTKSGVWAINAKFGYQRDPALKDQDPNPFTVERLGPLPR